MRSTEVHADIADGVGTSGRSVRSPEMLDDSLDWRRSYARRLWLTDLIALVWAVYGTQLLWFGFGNAQVAMREDSRISEFSYWIFSSSLVVVWMWALGLVDSRSHRLIGYGLSEYARVADSSLRLFGAIAIAAFLFRIDVARGYLLISLPLGVFMLITTRWLWRQWLNAHRRVGQYSARVMLIGSAESVAQVARELRRKSSAGYVVVGACVPGVDGGTVVPGTDIPMLGSVSNYMEAMSRSGADTVAVTSTDELPPQKVREISWALERGRQHLVLAPSILDVAGPRLHTRPVSGLPLVHVETPQFSLGQKFLKRAFDLVGACALVLLLAPVFVIVAGLVAASSPGPIIYKQERIGVDGKPFRMLKFRSMRVGADRELSNLLKAQGTTNSPLFKVKNDPRITPVGRFLRRYSLDELPQLLNVVQGTMSLVGPRPQVRAEVALYTDAARRRLITRPGLTGLWQVSGRSSLPWDEALRLDLYYVENWTLLTDLAILAKTAKAVIAPGATAH